MILSLFKNYWKKKRRKIAKTQENLLNYDFRQNLFCYNLINEIYEYYMY